MKILFTIIIASMQVLIVVIPLRGKLSDNRFKFPKNFTKLGNSLIICCLITLACSVWLFIYTESEERQSEKELTSQLKDRDSIHQSIIKEANINFVNKIDSSNKETIKLLAEYGLQYDSAQKVIEKLVRDSSKSKTEIIENPELSLCSVTGMNNIFFSNDTLILNLDLCSAKAISMIETLRLTTLTGDGDNYTLEPQNLKLISIGHIMQDKNAQIESNSRTIIQMRYPRVQKANMVYVRVYGTYTNQDKSKQFSIDIIHGYDLKNKQYGSASPKTNQRIRSFLSL